MISLKDLMAIKGKDLLITIKSNEMKSLEKIAMLSGLLFLNLMYFSNKLVYIVNPRLSHHVVDVLENVFFALAMVSLLMPIIFTKRIKP
jgi:hypothetical protein